MSFVDVIFVILYSLLRPANHMGPIRSVYKYYRLSSQHGFMK